MNNNTSSITGALAGLLVIISLGFSSAAIAESNESLAENTKPPLQIVNQTGLKVVVQVNYSDTVPNGISKQVLATKISTTNMPLWA